MFDNLSSKLEQALHTLKGRGRITEINISETLKEVRRVLLSADVNYKIAKEFTTKVKKKALGQKVITSLEPNQLMVKIMKDELTSLMGGGASDINLSEIPSIILISGLQGSGKTTFSSKLANYLKTKKSKKTLLVGADVYRPAAIEQLKILAEQIDVEVYTEDDNKRPIQIVENAIKYAKENKFGAVIVDTAGRLAVDQQMMEEISQIHKKIDPTETLFVVDAMTGQDAVNTAKAFNDILNFDGVVLTKLDGDTKGGAALSIRYVVNKPIKFVGTGEKIDALSVFHPERMADRILGMGDIVSLVEKAQEHYNEEETRRVAKKIAKNNFGFDEFLKQIHQIKRMGNLKDLVGMIPGTKKMMGLQEIDDDTFKSIEAIIYSMTPKERQNPKILDANRKQRIAKGAGVNIAEVNQLIKQFDGMRKMMKMIQGSGQMGLNKVAQMLGFK